MASLNYIRVSIRFAEATIGLVACPVPAHWISVPPAAYKLQSTGRNHTGRLYCAAMIIED